MTEVKNTKQKK